MAHARPGWHLRGRHAGHTDLMRTIPIVFIAGAFLVSLVGAAVAGEPALWVAPVLVALLGGGLLLLDRSLRRTGGPAERRTDDLVGTPPGRPLPRSQA